MLEKKKINAKDKWIKQILSCNSKFIEEYADENNISIQEAKELNKEYALFFQQNSKLM